ncbi:MAG TPA: hypothetical protein VMZ91_05235 [Candidatus Paceibacterota bacterium]|nr:hypothetical protein [Candidatus Paceibacterota bacterium]
MKKTDAITKPLEREIIENFVKEITLRRKDENIKPKNMVIFFRNEHTSNIERPVYEVPIGLLRYRKNNGRISSDVMSYEKDQSPLLEKSEDAQKMLRKFLEDKDPEQTKKLMNSIMHMGQKEPAIITKDGFLINGNRRKVALEKLHKKTREEKFGWMKVVILPGKNDPGGPPTLTEIEQIENRYQLQSEGKSEYSNYDRALSIRNKINLGLDLKTQLLDDPNYKSLSKKELEKVIKNFQEEYLEPLKSIDRYLEILSRPGRYDTISTGTTDREGRWQAFLDYSKNVRKKLNDVKERIKLNVNEDETGDIEEIAFKIIRKRDFPNLPKVHQIMRDLPRWLENTDSKNELFKLLKIDFKLPGEECFDKEGKEISEREKDFKWSTRNQTELIGCTKKAKRLYDYQMEKDSPLTLLEESLKKLKHKGMIPEAIEYTNLNKAIKLAEEIKKSANRLRKEFYQLIKQRN